MKQYALFCCILGLIGCGPSTPTYKLAPFSGVVKMDGKPLANATVFFMPTAGTKGPGGQGITDTQGKYNLVLSSNVGGSEPAKGIVPGDYKVRFSKFTKPDGTEIPADSKEPPINLGAIESIPARFNDMAESLLQAKVPDAGGTQDFELTSR